jgi:hypothetical protein
VARIVTVRVVRRSDVEVHERRARNARRKRAHGWWERDCLFGGAESGHLGVVDEEDGKGVVEDELGGIRVVLSGIGAARAPKANQRPTIPDSLCFFSAKFATVLCLATIQIVSFMRLNLELSILWIPILQLPPRLSSEDLYLI